MTNFSDLSAVLISEFIGHYKRTVRVIPIGQWVLLLATKTVGISCVLIGLHLVLLPLLRCPSVQCRVRVKQQEREPRVKDVIVTSRLLN